MDLEVKLLSLNINGLNSKIKRQRTFARLIKQKESILASAEEEKNGIAVYIKEEIEAALAFVDPKGRFLARLQTQIKNFINFCLLKLLN
ncbi:hypothetical protein E2320_003443 [Naja naja]|nr:hypothetical protein E2320_003443 [Naja naja]